MSYQIPATRKVNINPPAPSYHRGINLQVRIVPTEEMFTLRKVLGDMKIEALKAQMEFVTGVPLHLQRLHYLDEGDLIDSTDVKSNDLVSGALLQMDIWNIYKDLFLAASQGDIEEVFLLGVTQRSSFNTPSSLYMKPEQRRQWLRERAFLALYIACHRGHLRLCQRLIDEGVDVNGHTPLGRTPLHVVAARGHGDIVDLLLEKGADINAVDLEGKSSLDVAAQFGHKACERHLFLFRWQVRAKGSRPKYLDPPLMAHQFNDSAFPLWRNGPVAQIYMQNILPPSEYQGSALHAPRSKTSDWKKRHMMYGSDYDEEGELRESRSARAYRQGRPVKKRTFDDWLQSKQRVEQVKINRRQAVEARKKEEEEDKKRAAAEKQESYETWLARQQGLEAPPTKQEKHRGRGRRGRGGPQAKDKEQSSQPAPPPDPTADPAKDVRTRADRERSIYEDWLSQKEQAMFDSIVTNAPVIESHRVRVN